MTRDQAITEAQQQTTSGRQRFAVVVAGDVYSVLPASRTAHLEGGDILAIFRPEPDGSCVLCGGWLLQDLEVAEMDSAAADAA